MGFAGRHPVPCSGVIIAARQGSRANALICIEAVRAVHSSLFPQKKMKTTLGQELNPLNRTSRVGSAMSWLRPLTLNNCRDVALPRATPSVRTCGWRIGKFWRESPLWCSLVQIGRRDNFQLMRDLLLLAIHLLRRPATVARRRFERRRAHRT